MRATRFIFPAVLAACVSACGGSSDSVSAASGPTANPNDLTLDTGPFEIPPDDSFTCFYTNVTTTKEISVDGATGTQALGGHHILVYYTDVPKAPQHHACDEAEMVSWHQVAGAAGNNGTGAEGLVSLPAGLALKVPAGKQLVIQAHYINTTGATRTVDDTVTVHEVDPKDVKDYANYFALVDETFEVPANGSLSHQSICTVPQDLQAILVLGHMHEFGKHYTLDNIDETGAVIENMYDKTWAPEYTSHPPLIRYDVDKPLMLKKGMRIRQTCDWINTQSTPLTFPREMCVGFFYYYPDDGELLCDMVYPK